jgi:hypothetical protein
VRFPVLGEADFGAFGPSSVKFLAVLSAVAASSGSVFLGMGETVFAPCDATTFDQLAVGGSSMMRIPRWSIPVDVRLTVRGLLGAEFLEY